MRHFGKISKTLGKHLEAVKTTKGYYVDPIFSEVWRDTEPTETPPKNFSSSKARRT
eukprot:COSAG03_NODE_680_length_6345_cov_66.753122_3_plen_56_part_00